MSSSAKSLSAAGSLSAAPARFEIGFNEGTLALLASAILLAGAVVWSAHLNNVQKVDFSLTYVGANIVRHGQGSRLYDEDLQKQTRDSLFEHPSPLFFEHPPFEALLLSPLAALPFRSAYVVWGLFNAAVLLSLIIFLRRHLPWPRELLGYVCLWLLFAPLTVALYQGQSSIILLALFAGAFVLLKQARDLAAGFLLGFGLVKFQFVLPFVFIFLVLRRWRFLTGFLLSAGLLGVMSIAVVGLRGMEQYIHFVLTIAASPQNQSYGSAVDMPTIHGFLYALFGDRIGHVSLNILSGLVSVLLLALIAGRWQSAPSETSKDLCFAAAVAASLVTGAHMFTHDFSPLILAMFLAAAHLHQAAPHLRLLLALTLAIFWTFPVYFLAVAWHCMYLLCPLLLLFIYTAVETARFSASPSAAEPEYLGA